MQAGDEVCERRRTKGTMQAETRILEPRALEPSGELLGAERWSCADDRSAEPWENQISMAFVRTYSRRCLDCLSYTDVLSKLLFSCISFFLTETSRTVQEQTARRSPVANGADGGGETRVIVMTCTTERSFSSPEIARVALCSHRRIQFHRSHWPVIMP